MTSSSKYNKETVDFKTTFQIYICLCGSIFCGVCAHLRKYKCNKCRMKLSLKEGDIETLNDGNISCNSCGYKTLYSEMESHHQSCEKIEIECADCKLRILRSEVSQHSCNVRWEVECPYGCDTSGFSELELRNHRTNKFIYHLDIVYSIITYFGLDHVLRIEDGKSEETFPFYEQLMSDQTNDIVEYKDLISEVNDLKQKVYLKRFEKEEQMRLLERSIDIALLTSFDGTIVWMLNEDFIDDIRKVSPIFYTGKYGYKLQLIVNVKEDDQEILLIFLEGMYDPILKEKFKTNVKVEYKFKEEDKSVLLEKMMEFDRKQIEVIIPSIRTNEISWIKFEMDCSEFDFPSVE